MSQKRGRAWVLTTLWLCVASLAASGAAVDYTGARKVSDSFMAALVANKLDDAVDLMEPVYLQKFGRAGAEERLQTFFGYCGRPRDSEFEEARSGVEVRPDGKRIATRTFYYGAGTNLFLKGTCWFSVVVVDTPVGLRITEYGAVKQHAGEI